MRIYWRVSWFYLRLHQEIVVQLYSNPQFLEEDVTCSSHEGAEPHTGALVLQLHHVGPAGWDQLCQLLSQLPAQNTGWATHLSQRFLQNWLLQNGPKTYSGLWKHRFLELILFKKKIHSQKLQMQS